ncbi:MAG: hypothetical protein OXH57_11960 [Ekhidna sp.]|nr:hypothetical protein [Ekhidna sp.]
MRLTAIYILTFLTLSAYGQNRMTPIRFYKKLSERTQSKGYTEREGEEQIKRGKCKRIVKKRYYVAPVASSANGDIKRAGKGVDEWIYLDNGNAYMLRNYKWVMRDYGVSQLELEFDTMICEGLD